MAITLANLVSDLDNYIGDSSTNSLSSAERLQFLTEGVVWLQEELQNDLQNETYELEFLDTVNVYRVTAVMADLFEAVDLRAGDGDRYNSWSRRSSRELVEDIAQGNTDDSYAIERHDDDNYLVINHYPKYPALNFERCESLTENGTWTADTTTSDATNLTLDDVEFSEGGGSFNFDITVGQSVNNRATISVNDLDSIDLSDHEDLSSFLIDVYIPDVTNFTSVTFYWGTSSSAYWSATKTTDINGGAWVTGWNTARFDWRTSTMTSTPTSDDINYARIDFNYGAGQTSDTDFRVDNIRVVRPEPLTFYYTTWSVGTNSGGTKIYSFTATTDIPFFSGQYDQYRYAVAHQAASLVFGKWRERAASTAEESNAVKALERARNGIPSSIVKEEKAFKSKQINFKRRKF